jgi:hypothetical protein
MIRITNKISFNNKIILEVPNKVVEEENLKLRKLFILLII